MKTSRILSRGYFAFARLYALGGGILRFCESKSRFAIPSFTRFQDSTHPAQDSTDSARRIAHESHSAHRIAYKATHRIIFTILLIFGFSAVSFAGPNYPEGDGNNNVKASGKWYRCFANIGHTLSHLQNNAQWIGHAKYCLPWRPTHCTKEWDWSLDPKDDTVSETEASKKCQPNRCRTNGGGNSSDAHVFVNGAGRQTPVETYYYCVYAADWDKVAKCIDKSTGDTVPGSVCDKDATGANYYYKPKCDSTDTKESCKVKLDKITQQINKSFGWRFCYQPPESSNVKSYYRNSGGQTVKFKEFINDKGTKSGPCEQFAIPLGGGNPPDEEPDEPLGTLTIIDWDDNLMGVSRVHTKISMQAADFKLYTEAGKITSGIQSATCEITGGGTSYKGNAGSKFSFGSLWAFKFSAPKEAFPRSGEYKIKCDGVGKDGKSVSAEVPFFVAPHSYKFGVVSAVFNNTTSAESKGGVVTENIIEKPQTADFSTTKTAPTHDNQSWTKKPVVKIGELLTLQVNDITAQTATGNIDGGVDGKSGVGGTISMDTNDSKINPRAITDATKIPPTTGAASGACVVTPTITTNDAEMIGGTITTLETIATIQADNALLANAEVLIYDKLMNDKIKEEEGLGLCGDSAKFPCPYPGRLKISFDYQIVPADFSVELLTHKGDAQKVLYFGQGHTPSVEKGGKIRVTALKKVIMPGAKINTSDIATTFADKCAAQDITLSLEAQGGIKVELVDKTTGNTTDARIPANKFASGKAEIDDAILKVTKNDMDFTPAMKSEPAFIDANALTAKMEFFGYPPTNTYYPNYESIANVDMEMVVLRARINAIDTDNIATNFGNASPMKVWYEFQCEYCDLSRVADITGWNRYGTDDRSPTQQGWWIDRTFENYNGTKLDKNKVHIESDGNNSKIKSVSEAKSGLQEIAFNTLGAGTHKLNILHGNYTQGNTAISMPNFLLYNAYWNQTIKWHTSAFIYINSVAPDDKRNYGVDTGGAKNTRSGGRTGKY